MKLDMLKIGMLALLLAIPSVAFAKNGRPEDSSGHKSGGSSNAAVIGKFEAKLRGANRSHGALKLESNAKNGVVREARFDVRADIAPATIADTTSELRVEIARAGALVATCLAVFDDIEVEHRVPLAEYKTDIRVKRSGAPTAKAGYCDIDQVTDGVQNGLPALAAGDTVTVINPSTGEVLLSGSVNKKRK